MADLWKCCLGGAVVDLDELRSEKISAVWCVICGRFFYSPKCSAQHRKRHDILRLRPGDFTMDEARKG